MFSDRLTTETNRPMKGSFAAKTGHPRTQLTLLQKSVSAQVRHQERPPAFFRDKKLPCRDNLKTVNYLPTWNLNIDGLIVYQPHVCINAGLLECN